MSGEFTKRTSVYHGMPYYGFTDLELLVIEKALRLVWDEAPKRSHCHRMNFRMASEDEISSALLMVFDNIWAFNRELLAELDKTFHHSPQFNCHHGALDYLGRALTFRPDITFLRKYTPYGMSALNGCLFIEAKVIDRSRTMGTYCGDGLARFVKGKYAWAVPQAMMIGYVSQTDQHLPDTLATHFHRRGKREEYKLTEGPIPFPLSRFSSRSYLTKHDRNLTYPETHKPLGPISVLHLWLPIP